ncbi:hypothetical protein ACEZCY_21360 [Streptacidiphilus sp. N1-12]|uniref:Recombination endonuclease VII n=2 Tax=Streptacidiphilus alkalitolerans TaxID=3342712 RepID=A0ABV6WI83_9ACTN
MDTTAPRTGFGSPVRKDTAREESQSTDPGDRLRHIICTTCFPAFAGTREAPHDAVCVCGKPVRKGDPRSPQNAMQCILCNELLGHHEATAHL